MEPHRNERLLFLVRLLDREGHLALYRGVQQRANRLQNLGNQCEIPDFFKFQFFCVSEFQCGRRHDNL